MDKFKEVTMLNALRDTPDSVSNESLSNFLVEVTNLPIDEYVMIFTKVYTILKYPESGIQHDRLLSLVILNHMTMTARPKNYNQSTGYTSPLLRTRYYD